MARVLVPRSEEIKHQVLNTRHVLPYTDYACVHYMGISHV